MISIIVPVYNAENYLCRCIDSILLQTYSDFELILVDDGSIDSSLNICREYAQNDSRIVVLSQSNAGAGAARNYGLSIAKGEYIGFVDSDDYIDKNMYQKMLDAAEHHNADIVQCGHHKVSSFGEVLYKAKYVDNVFKDNKSAFKAYCEKKIVDDYSPCKIFKRELVKDICFGKYKYSEDAYFIIQAFSKCSCFAVTSANLYFYVQTDNSTCRRPYNTHYNDTIIVGEYMYNLTKNIYPDLAFYFARYVSKWIRYNYIHSKLQGQSADVLSKYFNKYKHYFGKSKVFFPKNIEEALSFLFRISPKIYLIIKSK